MGAPYTQCDSRWLNHNVAIATMPSKNTLTGAQASSTVGAANGDSQVNWITESTTDDHQNVHVAAINSDLSLVTWETLTSPICQPVPLSCTGTYVGTSFQLVDASGAKVGAAVTSTSVFVSGDIANVGLDKVCWPYVDMKWDLSAPKDTGALVTKMSFACASVGGGCSTVVPVASSTSAAAPVASTSASVKATGTSASSSTPFASPPATVGDVNNVATSNGVASSPVPTATSSAVSVSSPVPAVATSRTFDASSSATIPTTSVKVSGHHPHQYTTLSTVRKPAPTIAVEEDDTCS
jgi:hypothetical protein